MIDKESRGKNLGKKLLRALSSRDFIKHKIKYLETSITPSNKASKNLFYSFAKSLKTDCREEEFFSKELFKEQSHEEEILFRIGPFKKA